MDRHVKYRHWLAIQLCIRLDIGQPHANEYKQNKGIPRTIIKLHLCHYLIMKYHWKINEENDVKCHHDND